MTPHYQIPRNSLAWMLVAQMAVILPHIVRLPVWVLSLCTLCCIWRVLVFKGRLPFPPWYVRAILIVVGFVGVLLSYGKVFQLQPMVTVLIIAFYLKLIEMHKRRDAHVVVFLAYFIIATEFIYDQSMAVAGYMFFCVILVTTALIGLTQSQGHKKPWHSFLLTSKLVVQALPLTVVIFILFPRIPPLWSVPTDETKSRTGMSDTMSPGDFSNLSQSTEIAFRASFEGKIPNTAELYWRGLIYDYFDGRIWSQRDTDFTGMGYVRWFGQQIPDWEYEVQKRGAKVKYEIMLEPTNHPWLYSLTFAEPETWGNGIARDFRLLRDNDINQTYTYKVTSFLDHRIELDPPDWVLERNLQLPVWGNPKARELAKKWRAETNSDYDLMVKALKYFNTAFIYTLNPPRLGVHTIDEFLFKTRSGFCEHFSSAFVFLMRSAGVPARVVAGYQGGEANSYENYLLVHQFDAHAWAEIWLKGVGWMRVDPTAAVAPERVQKGLEEAVSEEGTFLQDSPFSPIHWRRIPLFGELRMRADQLNYAWVRWVIGYKPQLQQQLLEKLLGEMSYTRVALALLVFCSLGIGLIALSLYRQGSKKKIDPLTRQYLDYCERLATIGYPRNVGETPADFVLRIGSIRPDLLAVMSDIQNQFYALTYQKNHYSAAELRAFKDKIRQFRPARRVA